MIASDGIPYVNGKAHPRGAGTFSRVLGVYARERGVLTLMEALAKMTSMPARRLAPLSAGMANKGRLQAGFDADVTVFDAERIADNATFAEPARRSTGIAHVLVNGQFVVRDGRLLEGVLAGEGVRGDRIQVPAAGATGQREKRRKTQRVS
jgi:N-acyl-D-aspartate/D-glutamate deacylase